MHIVALDTETLALGSARDRLVQFCAIELDEELREVGRWTQFVNPGRPIPAHATLIHGITDSMVEGQPSFADVAPALRAFLSPQTILIAYNAGFDVGVLNAEFERCGLPKVPSDQPIIDPLAIERVVTSRSLGPTYLRYMGRPLENAHKADADTEGMVDVLRAQRRVHASSLPADLVDLVGWPETRRHFLQDQSGQVRLSFGRHRGRLALEVPDYLEWMLTQDFPVAAKRRARTLLKRAGMPGVALQQSP